MTFSFHPEAESEFLEAIEYYESCKAGLGLDFALEVEKTIRNIVAHPEMWPVLDDDIRRTLTNRFPYGVLYSVEGDGVLILAVMHLHRDPEYWKKRHS